MSRLIQAMSRQRGVEYLGEDDTEDTHSTDMSDDESFDSYDSEETGSYDMEPDNSDFLYSDEEDKEKNSSGESYKDDESGSEEVFEIDYKDQDRYDELYNKWRENKSAQKTQETASGGWTNWSPEKLLEAPKPKNNLQFGSIVVCIPCRENNYWLDQPCERHAEASSSAANTCQNFNSSLIKQVSDEEITFESNTHIPQSPVNVDTHTPTIKNSSLSNNAITAWSDFALKESSTNSTTSNSPSMTESNTNPGSPAYHETHNTLPVCPTKKQFDSLTIQEKSIPNNQPAIVEKTAQANQEPISPKTTVVAWSNDTTWSSSNPIKETTPKENELAATSWSAIFEQNSREKRSNEPSKTLETIKNVSDDSQKDVPSSTLQKTAVKSPISSPLHDHPKLKSVVSSPNLVTPVAALLQDNELASSSWGAIFEQNSRSAQSLKRRLSKTLAAEKSSNVSAKLVSSPKESTASTLGDTAPKETSVNTWGDVSPKETPASSWGDPTLKETTTSTVTKETTANTWSDTAPKETFIKTWDNVAPIFNPIDKEAPVNTWGDVIAPKENGITSQDIKTEKERPSKPKKEATKAKDNGMAATSWSTIFEKNSRLFPKRNQSPMSKPSSVSSQSRNEPPAGLPQDTPALNNSPQYSHIVAAISWTETSSQQPHADKPNTVVPSLTETSSQNNYASTNNTAVSSPRQPHAVSSWTNFSLQETNSYADQSKEPIVSSIQDSNGYLDKPKSTETSVDASETGNDKKDSESTMIESEKPLSKKNTVSTSNSELASSWSTIFEQNSRSKQSSDISKPALSENNARRQQVNEKYDSWPLLNRQKKTNGSLEHNTSLPSPKVSPKTSKLPVDHKPPASPKQPATPKLPTSPKQPATLKLSASPKLAANPKPTTVEPVEKSTLVSNGQEAPGVKNVKIQLNTQTESFYPKKMNKSAAENSQNWRTRTEMNGKEVNGADTARVMLTSPNLRIAARNEDGDVEIILDDKNDPEWLENQTVFGIPPPNMFSEEAGYAQGFCRPDFSRTEYNPYEFYQTGAEINQSYTPMASYGPDGQSLYTMAYPLYQPPNGHMTSYDYGSHVEPAPHNYYYSPPMPVGYEANGMVYYGVNTPVYQPSYYYPPPHLYGNYRGDQTLH